MKQSKKNLSSKFKKPWLAALLNLIIPGLGYLYVGRRITFAVLLVSGEILALIGDWKEIFSEEPILFTLNETLLTLSLLLTWIAFAYDGYKTAESYNIGK
ncbi:hypothetical protein J4212_03025 [Candidatus Woesearchaeota archaeon]|nr:hypothetical protein [Candidatus Woesearchaeota archaeon]